MIRTIKLDRFKEAVGFIPTFSCKWGNTRKANIADVSLKQNGSTPATDEAGQQAAEANSKRVEAKAKERMQLKKQLIVSPEYDAIKSFHGEIRAWVYKNTVPSFFKEGFQLVSLSGVEAIEKRMRKALNEELPKLVEAFIAAYPTQIEEAKKVLEPVGQFNANDYPPADEMKQAFGIVWNWVNFAVPEGLPPELRQAEQDKLEKQFSDAGEQITAALRVGFAELVKHAQERLTSQPGEKSKTFRDSMLGNIQEFIDTFQQRNLLNDVELAQLVARAKEILQGVTPQKVRDYADIKNKLTTGLAEITSELDKMIVEKPNRKFDLDE